MFAKIKDLYGKYKEIINYIFFGALTTAVNFIVYYLFANLLHVEEVTSNVIAWLLSVLFAFVTNKLFVFNHHSDTKKALLYEFSSFVGCRIFSGILDTGIFALCVKVFHLNDFVVKLFTQVLVIIMNYVTSKLITFRKKNK